MDGAGSNNYPLSASLSLQLLPCALEYYLRPRSGGFRPMNCQEARDSLSLLLDGDIGLTERVPLELHVNNCDGCQRRLAHLQQLRELEQRPRPMPRAIHWRPIHWRPFLAPGFVEKA